MGSFWECGRGVRTVVGLAWPQARKWANTKAKPERVHQSRRSMESRLASGARASSTVSSLSVAA
eukprot:2315299-Lingulodinium_polyedra.AAC.1